MGPPRLGPWHHSQLPWRHWPCFGAALAPWPGRRELELRITYAPAVARMAKKKGSVSDIGRPNESNH